MTLQVMFDTAPDYLALNGRSTVTYGLAAVPREGESVVLSEFGVVGVVRSVRWHVNERGSATAQVTLRIVKGVE